MKDDREAMAEWRAWHQVCGQLEALLGYSVNDERCDKAVKAIKLWGERLAELNALQTPDVVSTCRADAEAAYERHALPDRV